MFAIKILKKVLPKGSCQKKKYGIFHLCPDPSQPGKEKGGGDFYLFEVPLVQCNILVLPLHGNFCRDTIWKVFNYMGEGLIQYKLTFSLSEQNTIL